MQMHPSITRERVRRAVKRRITSLDDPGFCIACGVEVSGVEPDAREHVCKACGAAAVYGAEELQLQMQAGGRGFI